MTTDLWAGDVYAPNAPAITDIPRDLDAERIVVASAMARPEIIEELADRFDPADISDDRLRWTWFAIEEIRTTLTAGEIRWHAVERQLQAWRADGTLPVPPPTATELARLYSEAQPASAGWYAEKITKAAVAARVVAFGVGARVKGASPAFDPDADVAELQATLDQIIRPGQVSTATPIGDLIGAALQRAVTPPAAGDRIPTGFMDLDACLSGGFAPGQLVVIGARPAMGKTTLGMGMARAAAIRNGICTLVRSLEMSDEEIATSVLSAEARISLHHLKEGTADDEAMARAARATPAIAAAPLHIDDTHGLSLPALRAQVRHLVRTAGLRLVVIDYLQLMEAPRAESRQVAVSMLSRGLKIMAREFGITVVLLSQLNRGPEQRQDKKPMVADLRESGAVEQDADIVILLHREDAYDKESPRAGEADLILGKHRGGPTGTITVAFAGHYARFVDMAAP